MPNNARGLRAMLRASTAVLGLAAASLAVNPANAIVINNNYTPSQVVDTTNVTGIGQMVIDQQNGYIGLCTATLINPRTVILAAHCVNENSAGTGFKDPATYGAKFGGTPIAFFFNANNNVSGNSAIGHWLRGVSGGAAYQTRTAENAYNANYVTYNSISTSLGIGNNFLQGDIAMAALDTPASNIPTWTLLFSPLTSATHATIAGYGNNGTGTTGGSGGIDYRRRVAENMISVLGSLDDQDKFLFGAPDGLPQNLYMLDFNDPKYGTAQANAYDFNIFHDVALTKEGITAPGDSGGPLIVDQTFNKQVIAAVLSGGDRFYSGQPSSSYGTTSFYQPLYLYWDWIVANNPYKYVSAKTGDGSWTDPTHWVMNLDPNYVSLVSSALSNTLPTTPAQGLPAGSSVNSPKFGQVCYYNDCVDIATGKETIYPSSTTSGAAGLSSELASDPAQVKFVEDNVASDTSGAAISPSLVGEVLRSLINYELGSSAAAVKAEGSAVINGVSIQGAPGSSNFVPNNTDGNPTAGAPARYYDVTLSADGTTTLSNATVVIDRLTINGAKTGLTIASTGALGSMIDATMYAGTFRVDGLFVSNGDLALLGGILTGSGTVVAPYTTAVLGAIAPGTLGTTGTLTVQGSVVFSSKSTFLADVTQSGSDLLSISGSASLGGTAIITPVGYTPKWHDTKTVISAASITGSFSSVPDTVAGVLYPVLKTVTIGTGASAYQTEVVTFEAASFSSVLPNMTEDQAAIGGLLDQNRAASYSAMSGVYDAIDPLSDSALGASLENLAPDAARALPKLTQLASDAYTSFLWQYLGDISPAGDAKVAIQTNALKMAENSHVGSVEMRNLLANLGGIDNAVSPLPADSSGGMKLPKDVGAFLSGQKLDGALTIGGSGGKADVDGYLIAIGVDMPFTLHLRAGVSLAFDEAEATLRNTPAVSKTSAKQLLAYGKYVDDNGMFVDGYFGGMVATVSTHRLVQVGSSSFNLYGHTSGLSPMFGVQAGLIYENIAAATVKPAIGLQYGEQNLTGYTETGGPAALKIADYRGEDVDFRLGFDAQWKIEFQQVVLKPSLHAFSVHKLDSLHSSINAGFALAPATSANFEVAPAAHWWGEVGVGLEADLCDNAVLGFRFNANPGRADSSYQAFGGSLRIKF